METKKRIYQCPSIKVIDVELHDILAASPSNTAPDFGYGGELDLE